jgi:hypothetical protein
MLERRFVKFDLKIAQIKTSQNSPQIRMIFVFCASVKIFKKELRKSTSPVMAQIQSTSLLSGCSRIMTSSQWHSSPRRSTT